MSCTLGDLISWLERCPPSAKVVFSDGNIPTTVDSSRGSYDELALGHEPAFTDSTTDEVATDNPTVLDLLATLRNAVGRSYIGYKGGEYKMYRSTPIFRDNWGEWTETYIVGGFYRGGVATIQVVNTRSGGNWLVQE